MIVGRALLFTLARNRFNSCMQRSLVNRRQNLALGLLACNISTHQISKNIEFITQDNGILVPDKSIQSYNEERNKPLLLILSWLLSKRKHIMKFANLYMEQGFDIAMVSVTPWQLLWPTKGSRLVAADVLDFLAQQQNYQQILLHGFSVGGYLWGEALDLIESDRQKYQNVIDRIVGQIWDSAADVNEIPVGTPRAVFPKNEMLQTMLKTYIEYHMKKFYNQSTQYYIRSSQLFHTSSVRVPALFFVSKTDPVGTLTSNLRLRDQWQSLGFETYVKVFEKSPHVGHFHKYPKEYVAELYAFLSKLNLIQNEEKMRAHL